MVGRVSELVDPTLGERFFWGCRIRRLDFTYIYGRQPEYRQAAALQDGRDHLHKGTCGTLQEAREAAEQQAAELAPIFSELGSVKVMPAWQYLERARPMAGARR